MMMGDRLADLERAVTELVNEARYRTEWAELHSTIPPVALGRRDELSVVKEYAGALQPGDLVLVECSPFYDTMTMGTPEWITGVSRTWIDDEVEAAIGRDAAAAVRERCGELLAQNRDPYSILSAEAGMPSIHRYLDDAWFDIAIKRRVPEVIALGPEYILFELGDDATLRHVSDLATSVNRLLANNTSRNTQRGTMCVSRVPKNLREVAVLYTYTADDRVLRRELSPGGREAVATELAARRLRRVFGEPPCYFDTGFLLSILD